MTNSLDFSTKNRDHEDYLKVIQRILWD